MGGRADDAVRTCMASLGELGHVWAAVCLHAFEGCMVFVSGFVGRHYAFNHRSTTCLDRWLAKLLKASWCKVATCPSWMQNRCKLTEQPLQLSEYLYLFRIDLPMMVFLFDYFYLLWLTHL